MFSFISINVSSICFFICFAQEKSSGFTAVVKEILNPKTTIDEELLRDAPLLVGRLPEPREALKQIL